MTIHEDSLSLRPLFSLPIIGSRMSGVRKGWSSSVHRLAIDPTGRQENPDDPLPEPDGGPEETDAFSRYRIKKEYTLG